MEITAERRRTRSERLEARATQEDVQVISHAATLLNESLSTFVVTAAREKAEVVVARADRTVMPGEQFDEMIRALDDPTPIRQLAELAAGPRRISRS